MDAVTPGGPGRGPPRGDDKRGPAAGPEDRQEALALLVLAALPGVGEVGVRRLRKAFGCGRAALAAPGTEVADVVGEAAARARGDAGLRRRAEETLAAAAEVGARVIPAGCAGWPAALDDLHAPPAVLYGRGDPALLEGPVVTVVGSRRSTEYGRRVAGRLGRTLAGHGVVVASGMALGIDAAAHRGALDAGGPTAAVLGSGPDRPSPRSHRRLHRAIVERGVVLTEFAPGTPPAAHHFPRRNRILAALARVVVVVEAARRSGALITARLAQEMERDVMAVPGPVDSPTSVGTNLLLADGARCVADPAMVLDLVLDLDATRSSEPPPAPPTALGDDAAALWHHLGERPRTVDELSRRAGLLPFQALSALSALEVEGWVRKAPGMRFGRTPGAG